MKNVLTQYGTHANTIADTFRAAFAKMKIGEHVIDMTAPEGSTGGGLLALQHITFKSPTGLALVVGTVNARDKQAELRSYGHVARVHQERFKRGLDFDQGSYAAFLTKSEAILSAFGLTITVVDVPRDPTPSVPPPAKSKAGLVIALVVLAVLVVVGGAGGAWFALFIDVTDGARSHSVVAAGQCRSKRRRYHERMTTAGALASTRSSRTKARRHYADDDSWRRYQAFFPEAMRCTAETVPTEEWWSWNGLDVHLDRLAVPESPLKVIVLHGAGAYGRVMAPAAVLARKHGFETVSPDLPGYGLTDVSSSRFTYSLWVDCVRDLIDAEIARDGRPVILFGVSLGGVLAYHAAARSRRVVGLVATTLADMREPAVREGFARTSLLGKLGFWFLKRLRVLTDGLPLPMRFMSKMNRISNKPELAHVCSTDPLGGGNWVPARFLRTLMEATPDLEPEAFDVCPVLLVHPGVDRMTEISLSRRFFDRLPGGKRMVVLEGASHMPTEHPGVDQLERAVVEFVTETAAREKR